MKYSEFYYIPWQLQSLVFRTNKGNHYLTPLIFCGKERDPWLALFKDMQNAKLRDILHHNNTTLAVKLSTQVYNEHILVFWFLYALESYLLGVISKIISYELCVLLWVTYLSVLQLSHTWKGIITVLTSEDCCEDEIHSVQLLSCVWLCDPMHCSTPGFPVHHQLPELTRSHVHKVKNLVMLKLNISGTHSHSKNYQWLPEVPYSKGFWGCVLPQQKDYLVLSTKCKGWGNSYL